MKSLISAFALLALAVPAHAQEAPPRPPMPEKPANLPPLTVSQTTWLRCAVNLAMVAKGQAGGVASTQHYPAVSQDRAREFFVQVMARLMDEAKLSRDQVRAYTRYETELMAAQGPDALHALMPGCFQLLEAAEQ